MPTFNPTVRIYGNELDVDDTYIDAQISGYSLDGKVKLVEDAKDSPREWIAPETNITTWRDRDVLIPHTEIANPDHEVWDLIAKLKSMIGDEELAAAEGEFREITEKLFHESVRAQRGTNPPGQGGNPPGLDKK